jgi:hypothetical protein
MKTINAIDLQYAGSFSVDSGQAIIGDPCYLDKYDTNVDEPWDLEGKIGQYSYQGISATTLASSFGQIGEGLAVAFTTGYGDGAYPVYVQFNDEGRISKVVIDFDGDLDEEQE